MRATAAYLYCVVHAATAPRVSKAPAGIPGSTGLFAEPAGASLWVIGSEVPLEQYGGEALERTLQDLERVAPIAVAHEAVVSHFSGRRGATVVPMKLFTMFSTIDRAVAETAKRRGEIRAVVRRISGCDEWGVRITRRPMAHPAPQRPVRPATGAAFLAARKAARDEAREAVRSVIDGAEGAYRALEPLARAARRREGAPEGAVAPLLDAAFLVPRAGRARFRAAAARFARAGEGAGFDLILTGPWPAYNFVQGDEARHRRAGRGGPS